MLVWKHCPRFHDLCESFTCKRVSERYVPGLHLTLKIFERAIEPSFSNLPLPDTKTLRASGLPAAVLAA